MMRPASVAIAGPKRFSESWLIAALFGCAILLGFLKQGLLLSVAYPAASLGLGLLLARRNPPQFIAFILWLFFLSPFIRRINDYTGGWTPISTLSLTPYLPALLVVPVMVQRLLLMKSKPVIALLPVVFAILYAFLVGAGLRGVVMSSYGLVTWLAPVAVAAYIEANARHFPRFERDLTITIGLGMLVMGLYGVAQYLFLPAWDRFWMINSQMTSIGLPIPYQVRVFSTMNSPAPFGATVAALVLILVGVSRPRYWPSIFSGLCGLLLSLLREAWGGFIVGLVLLMVQLSRRGLVKILIGIAIAGIAVVPVLQSDEIGAQIEARFQTIFRLEGDTSFIERNAFYDQMIPLVMSQPLGVGFGLTGVASKLENADTVHDFDSGVLEIPYVFGWPGTLLYVGGVLWVMGYCLLSARGGRPFSVAAAAAALSILVQMVFSCVLEGPVGVIFWILVGLVLADRAFRMGRLVPQSGHVGRLAKPSRSFRPMAVRVSARARQ